MSTLHRSVCFCHKHWLSHARVRSLFLSLSVSASEAADIFILFFYCRLAGWITAEKRFESERERERAKSWNFTMRIIIINARTICWNVFHFISFGCYFHHLNFEREATILRSTLTRYETFFFVALLFSVHFCFLLRWPNRFAHLFRMFSALNFSFLLIRRWARHISIGKARHHSVFHFYMT